ncbi:hypothetical protein N0V84_004525 [Fusarium piperis]|uniref:F-box domain-containing protein n=1 Tax=Fusarium piperis TaxID=1435070 RepID=A0A9W8WFD5_9HYPO|nr:hypothetical protein N0V84_004525 [Fusarium piperis]
MNFTPVHIRGKRKTPSDNKPSKLRPNPSHPKDDDNGPSSKKMKRSLSNVLASRSLRGRPTLQSLPTEILEMIFLYSESLSLPRSSPLIGAKLSSRVTLLRHFMWTFHDTWIEWFGIPVTCNTSRDLVDGDARLQSEVFELPWVKIDFILQAQQTWADTHAKDRHYEHCLPKLDMGRNPVIYSSDHPVHGHKGEFNARQCFEADYQAVSSWEPARGVECWAQCDVHPDFQAPHSLITGPWDEEKLRRLFWLRRAGWAFHWDSESVDWEYRLECLRNAFVDAPVPSLLMTNLLDLLQLGQGLPTDILQKERQRIEQRLEWGGDDSTGREVLRQVLLGTELCDEAPLHRY